MFLAYHLKDAQHTPKNLLKQIPVPPHPILPYIPNSLRPFLYKSLAITFPLQGGKVDRYIAHSYYSSVSLIIVCLQTVTPRLLFLRHHFLFFRLFWFYIPPVRT